MSNKPKITVLSLFDGISCARVALNRAGIGVGAYFASEVDKYAISISKQHHSEIIQLGDIKKINVWNELEIVLSDEGMNRHNTHTHDIDLLIGGSPCQDLSIAKKDRKGLDGERSGLFWEYVRILNEVQPRFFILENVASMSKEAKDTISDTLGFEPVMINASLVSAQNRKRLFWVGKRDDLNFWSEEVTYTKVEIPQPEDKGITLRDIVDFEKDRKWVLPENIKKTKYGISWDISGKGHNSQQDRAYSLDGKHPTIPTSRTITKIKFVADNLASVGVLNWDEVETLQGLPKGYTDLGDKNRTEKRGAVLGNSFNVDVVAHILGVIQSSLL